MALVLLREPTHRWCLCNGYLLILPGTCIFKARQSLMAREDSLDGPISVLITGDQVDM